MINDVRNIYCVGRNYKMHAAELGNAVPTEPMFFMKPTHALTQMDGRKISLPSNKGAIHFEAELVIHIGKEYYKGIQIEELVDQVSLGIDFTLRDLQSKLKAEGLPWLAAKGFRNSALIGAFIPFETLAPINELEFSLFKNGEEKQHGKVSDMIFSLQEIVDYCAEHFELGVGDLIYTGTPAGVGAVEQGDHLLLKMGNQSIGESIIQFN